MVDKDKSIIQYDDVNRKATVLVHTMNKDGIYEFAHRKIYNLKEDGTINGNYSETYLANSKSALLKSGNDFFENNPYQKYKFFQNIDGYSNWTEIYTIIDNLDENQNITETYIMNYNKRTIVYY